MTVYVVAAVDTHDPEVFAEYVVKATPSLREHRVTTLATSAPPTLEGDRAPGTLVLMEFLDRATAEAWYHSTDYQDSVPLRHRSADTPFIAMIESPAPAASSV